MYGFLRSSRVPVLLTENGRREAEKEGEKVWQYNTLKIVHTLLDHLWTHHSFLPLPKLTQLYYSGGPWSNGCLSRLTRRIKLLEQWTLALLCWLRMIWLWASYLTFLSLNFLISKFKINICPVYFRGLFCRRKCDIYKIALKILTCPTKRQALS